MKSRSLLATCDKASALYDTRKAEISSPLCSKESCDLTKAALWPDAGSYRSSPRHLSVSLSAMAESDAFRRASDALIWLLELRKDSRLDSAACRSSIFDGQRARKAEEQQPTQNEQRRDDGNGQPSERRKLRYCSERQCFHARLSRVHQLARSERELDDESDVRPAARPIRIAGGRCLFFCCSCLLFPRSHSDQSHTREHGSSINGHSKRQLSRGLELRCRAAFRDLTDNLGQRPACPG